MIFMNLIICFGLLSFQLQRFVQTGFKKKILVKKNHHLF